MSAPTRSDRGIEWRARVTVLGIPAGPATRISRSVDLIELARTGGQVVRSVRRLGPVPPALVDTVDHAVRAVADRVSGRSRARVAVQTLLGTGGAGWLPGTEPRPRVRVLVRAETAAGPLVLGGCGVHAAGEVARTLAVLDGLRPCPAADPAVLHGPVLLHPAVTAVVVAAARMVLGAPAAARLAGRRVLPPLTLIDEPVEHPAGGVDDSGYPVGPLELITGGRVRLPDREPGSGALAGRAVWCHDRGGLTAATSYRLVLNGLRDVARPDDPVELLCPIEGLQRYFPDGLVRVTCVARAGASPRWFLVRLRARPLSLLRTVLGGCGPAVELYSDHETVVPALLVPGTAQLEGSTGVHLELA